jgi:asparagine synthase (glutamine-hydrolysing)
MCGICGKVSPAGIERGELQAMLQAIAHRGPDDEGLFVNGSVGLGSRRVSIIDLPGGHQPLSNEDGTVWATYNGEIYNYQALRAELLAQGHRFQTDSDTEVLVHLYEEFGDHCVEKLSGMFAFAIWDERERKLLLARDRLGQKPLFYSQDGAEFRFASEVKALLAAGGRAPEMDEAALHHYLTLRFIPAPHTMLRHIRKLPPAYLLVYQNGVATLSRYWTLSFAEKLELGEQAYLDGLRDRLERTVRSHLVSDVPVGALLSGGMDSSMVVAMMAGELGSSFKTFAIGVEAQDFNELPYARLVAERFGTEHYEECVASDLVQLLPEMVWHLDEPSDPIAACQFHAAQLAARHVKVVLGGDGGDELFAGFDRYLGIGYVDMYALLPAAVRRKVLGPLIERLPDSFTYKSVTQKIRWMHSLSLLSGSGARYAAATSFTRFDHGDKQALFGSELWRRVGHLDSAAVITGHFDEAPATSMLDRMLYADYMTRLPEHSLMLVDRMTMAHGLEARSPFVDHELVEYMAAFPARLKIRDRQLKYVLRRLAADYLPPQIVSREKQGFMFPVAYWFRNELYPFLAATLLESDLVRDGMFNRDYVVRLLDEHRSSRVDHHVRLWMLLNVAVWHSLYIDQQSPADIAARFAATAREVTYHGVR